MERGDYDFRTSYTGISWIKWKDNKSMQFLFNFHDPGTNSSIRGRYKDGGILQLNSSQITRDYDSSMDYVDKADQLKSTNKISRKSKK